MQDENKEKPSWWEKLLNWNIRRREQRYQFRVMMHKGERETRDNLAHYIIGGSFAILGVVILFAFWLINSADEGNFDQLKEMLNLFLPLVGTWIGAVIAYYFGSKNFEAGGKNAQAIIDQHQLGIDNKITDMMAVDIMTMPDKDPGKHPENYWETASEEKWNSEKLIDVIEHMEDRNMTRLFVLDSDKKYVYLCYKRTMQAFIYDLFAQKTRLRKHEPAKKDRGGHTHEYVPLIEALKYRIEKAEQKEAEKTFGYEHGFKWLDDSIYSFVNSLTIEDMRTSDWQFMKECEELDKNNFMSIRASAEEVWKKMTDNSICENVVITLTGNRQNETVLGWITNEKLLEKVGMFTRSGSKGGG